MCIRDRQYTDLSSRWEGNNWLAVVVGASSGTLPLRARLDGRLVDGPHRACPFLLPRSGHRTVRGLGQDRDPRVGSRHVRLVIPRQRRSRGRVGSALVLGLFHRRYDPRFNRQGTGRLPEPQQDVYKRQLFDEAALVQRDIIRRLFLDDITPEEIDMLTGLFTRVSERLDSDTPCP